MTRAKVSSKERKEKKEIAQRIMQFYEVKGMFVVDKENGSIKSIDDVYYTTRTVLDQKRSVIAKRKHINDELAAVN